MKEYLLKVLRSLDQPVNAVFLNGSEDETVSARAWRQAQAGSRTWRLLRWAIDRIFFFDPAHCRVSYENELKRVHMPEEYRP